MSQWRPATVITVIVTMAACNGILSIPEVERRQDPSAAKDGAPAVDGSNGTDREGGTGTACGPREKLCGGECVSRSDPATGCGSADCQPCALPHATTICILNECAIVACENAYDDCNGLRDDGCEVDLTSDAQHCSKCGRGRELDFVCKRSTCACTSDDSCGYDGVCRDGRCFCDSERCSPGSTCEDYDACDF